MMILARTRATTKLTEIATATTSITGSIATCKKYASDSLNHTMQKTIPVYSSAITASLIIPGPASVLADITTRYLRSLSKSVILALDASALAFLYIVLACLFLLFSAKGV